MTIRTTLSALLVSGLVLGSAHVIAVQDRTASPQTPKAALDELLAADKAFSAASAKTDLVTGLTAMFAPDVMMPFPAAQFAEGAAKAAEALRTSNPENGKAKIEWEPARGGISADGQHGFTLGYMTMQRPDGTKVPLKYLAYWVKRPEGWRVAVYKRGRRGEGNPAGQMPPAALPAQLVAPTTNAATITKYRVSLEQAERAFSDEAQKIGLGPAFVKYGTPDSVNMGGPTDAGFLVGSEAIGKSVSGGDPKTSPVAWGPDKVIVASSGDLGVTIGWIHQKAKAADGTQAPPNPFFTIWRRDSPTAPWRYIAE